MKVCSVCQQCYEDEILSCSEENHGFLAESRAGSSELIPNYRLEFLHESSATGEAYRAVNTILKKTYLIKIIASDLFDEAAKKQFLRETQTLAAIIHPNVARIYESGVLADGSLYVVTEFLTAQTLRECLANVGAPSEFTALTIARQAAEGLEAIHAGGVLHRNIRPENIILTADAENRFLVKLQNIDFSGIAQKIVNGNGDRNLPNLKYFSPEQCAAQTAEAQTDVYSLGVVLYETLAGNVPFDAGEADVLINKQINEPPPPVKINNFDIRMLLTHTLTDALQKTTRLRLKTANAFVRRLRHIEQLATHSPTPPPAMSYPAAMNKAAVVFTPQPKIENAVETPTFVETLAPLETSPIIETAAMLEARTFVEEFPFPEAVIETPPVENLPLNEIQVMDETPVAVELQTAVEELPLVEPETPIADLSLIENETIVENAVVTENQTAAENSFADEVQTVAEENESPAVIYLDLTTNKLPPIESIIEKPFPKNLVITEITPIFSLKSKVTDIHKTDEPVLVEWEQPDDVPTITQALGKKRKEIADAEFAPMLNFIDKEDSVTDLGEIDAPFDSDAEESEPRRNYAAERDVFSYDDSGVSWNLPDKRKILTGAGIFALLVLAVGGTLLSRQFQSSSDAETTTAQSATKEKSPPKSNESDTVSETEKPLTAKPEQTSVSNPSSNAGSSDAPALPDFQPREINEKNAVPNPVKKRALKTSENREQTKIVSNPVFDKKGDVKPLPSDKKSADKNKLSTSAKPDIFTRPRIVKNPKY